VKVFIFFLILSGLNSFAKKVKSSDVNFTQNPVYQEYLKLLKSGAIKTGDNKNIVFFPKLYRRWDLTIYDLFDQVLLASKKYPCSYHSKKILEDSSNAVLLKFPSILARLKNECGKNKKLIKQLSKIFFQEYDLFGKAIPKKLNFKPLIIKRNNKIARFNDLINHPEGENIMKVLGLRKDNIFGHPYLTVTQLGHLKKKYVKKTLSK
jgi:hypothetical protein